jgi:5-methylthioadenosine/S-adenosylhomocysteine deaminase
MRERKLLTLNEADLLQQANSYAKRIDTFLIAREQSVLSKLVALGGSIEEESFEIQIKVKLKDAAALRGALSKPEIETLYNKHYRQYDTYFFFGDPTQGRLRYREDELIDVNGKVVNLRARLTLIGQNREGELGEDVLLSRSRYLAPAAQSLRFYREYFKPESEKNVEKERQRWKVKYQNVEFYINVDTLQHPELGTFLEIKSRTWSRVDAERKAHLTAELVGLLGASRGEHITHDYVELV